MNFSENLSMNTKLNLKTRLIWEKEKHTIISQMSWYISTPDRSSIVRCLSNAVVEVIVLIVVSIVSVIVVEKELWT